MNLWHLTADAPRRPRRVSPGQEVRIVAGTWPIEPGQSVRVRWERRGREGTRDSGEATAEWRANEGVNSYWEASLGPFRDGDEVAYAVHGLSLGGAARAGDFAFRVKPALNLAILWHHHQPLYRDPEAVGPAGSYHQPWVRLHALRDYYAMAAMAAEHGVPVTFNLTPVLLRQIDDYVRGGATDRALELTRRPAEALDAGEIQEILATFFDADWHHQIHPHARYRSLLGQRMERRHFSVQDVRDLQMWFSLAWFGHEMRAGEVPLVTGEIVSVRRLVERQQGFSHADVEAMIAEQYKVLRAIVPLHRDLQARRVIEVSTTPAFHPILPLLIDTDRAPIDRPGATHPRRFAHPEDAEAQVELAVADYQSRFGLAPRGVWPAEGAVSAAAVASIAAHGLRWTATDRGVLARSGRWGYDVERAAVLCRPYRFVHEEREVAVFFRDTSLSDALGFHYQHMEPRAAADAFVKAIEERFLHGLDEEDTDRVLTIVLDGENAWGAYAEDGRPFLHALYRRIAADPRLRAVTFSEYLEGSSERGVDPHPIATLEPIHGLATGSWIDEIGSDPGIDLGTWIGETEENHAWDLLGEARGAVAHAAPGRALETALAHLYAAEGSDWFWWFGEDQESGNDADFDDLFRRHLRQAYRAAGLTPPDALDEHIVPHRALWTFTRPIDRIAPGDLLTVRTNCPGRLAFRVDAEAERSVALAPVGGVLAGARRFQVTLGPFPLAATRLTFRFRCEHAGCPGDGPCCLGLAHGVSLREARPESSGGPTGPGGA